MISHTQLIDKSQSSRPTGWTPLPGNGEGFVRDDWQDAFARMGLSTIEDFLGDVGEAMSKPGLGTRYRARLRVLKNGTLHSVYLKRYGKEKISNRVRRWLEDGSLNTPADRDVHVADTLSRQGISVPQTLAWGKSKGLTGSLQNFVVSAPVPGDALDRQLNHPDFQKWCAGSTQKNELIESLAVLVRNFHGLGWCHRDLYLCHVFIELQASKPALSIIDLQRVFRPRWRHWRWRIKDLAQLNYSAKPDIVSKTMRFRFLKAYFGHRSKLSAFEKSVLRRIAKKTEFISHHDRSRPAK